MMPEISNQIASAVALLRAGRIVAFPTETVYGLGADITIPSAINRVFEIKGRPVGHPLIVHFSEMSQLEHWAQEIPKSAWQLAKRFWPGPLTLILPRTSHVSLNVTGGQNMVGLRIPDHPIALALLNAMGPERALAAPSANLFGRISPTTADHVFDELGFTVDMILDGGPCKIGLESTIVGFSGKTTIVLRPGGIPQTELAEVLNEKVTFPNRKKPRVRVPGSLDSHYAPLTPLEVWPTKSLLQRVLELKAQGLRTMLLGWSAAYLSWEKDKDFLYFSMPKEPTAYGNQLYTTLRRFDNGQFDRLLLEAPPNNPAWLAIVDRLQRASCVPFIKAQDGDF
ncbi:MAG: threonylcarbamoyl-AMP synthase [Betaproteobacteria bacterium]|nr:MAG: threonylcarbamoyl-AMP synthase [Betaproteobacteria bacterium]